MRTPAAILRAFIDRTSIDWSAAARKAADHNERDLIEQLRRLESLRAAGSRSPVQKTSDTCVWPLAAATAFGMAQVLSVVVVAAVSAPTADPIVPGMGAPLALAVAFSTASLMLAAAALRDDRAFLLLATFVLAASAFAHPLLDVSAPAGRILSTPLFRGLYPEVFASAALWELAVVFPSVRRFTAIDLFARRGATFAWTVASGLFLLNLLAGYFPDMVTVGTVGRNHPGNLYWRIFAAMTLPAVALVLVRAHRAPRLERQKVFRFAGAIAACTGPFLVLGAARSIPSVDTWTRSLTVRTWMDPIVLVSLGALPVLASIAVLVDAPFEPMSRYDPSATRARRWLHRSWAFCARRLRQRRLRERLSASLDHLRLARGSRELIAVLSRELQVGVGAGTVTILDARALPPDTALLPLLAEADGLIDLSRDCEPFLLLPRQDREWLDENSVSLAAAVRLRNGAIPAVVLLGQPPRGDGFHRADRWFTRTLVIAAAAAWPDTEVGALPDDPADECARCGRVKAAGEPCCTNAVMNLAALPRRLAGKYTITRRLGAGGMGVVYLGRDEGLGRDVALKTLPGMRDGAVARLQEEARVMAALNHPAIATIYGVEIWRGTPVLVLEYCPGGTLAAALADGELPVDEVLRLGFRLADALAYMHGRDVLHRDVKPSNIGFASDGTAKLLDFGLAGAHGYAGGTRAYLPPEALAGAPADAAVDLWGLAVVLREACTPDHRLAGFLKRALAYQPADRYRSALDMATALRVLLKRPGDVDASGDTEPGL